MDPRIAGGKVFTTVRWAFALVCRFARSASVRWFGFGILFPCLLTVWLPETFLESWFGPFYMMWAFASGWAAGLCFERKGDLLERGKGGAKRWLPWSLLAATVGVSFFLCVVSAGPAAAALKGGAGVGVGSILLFAVLCLLGGGATTGLWVCAAVSKGSQRAG